MGYGYYKSSDWSKLKSSSSISESSTASQLFKNNVLKEKYDPKYIDMRESMDSEDHPNSTPVILGLDTTGSMGYLSTEIAKNGLNETMLKIYSTKPIEDPQLMFMAIGDVRDYAPLQVTQFESDIRIAEQLMDLWLEGRGADAPEDFELAWYFAAKHTKIDSFDKHKKKGFLITIGDADVHEDVTGKNIKKIFNDESKDYSSKELADMASEKYEVFHIQLNDSGAKPATMNKIIPGRVAVIRKNEVKYIPEVIISIMQYSNGMSKKEILAQWSDLAQPIVSNALRDINVSSKKGGLFF